MKIEEMLDRVIVIDNIKEEARELVQMLQSYDIAVDFPDYTENYSQFPVYTHNRQLVFIDLMLDENEDNYVTNTSRVIQILNHIIGQGFGPYGLVVWTKHSDKLKELLKRFTSLIQHTKAASMPKEEDDEEIMIDIQLDNPPLFIISVDKTQFKSSGVWDFRGLLPILNQQIQESNASYFFLRWLSLTRLASQETISSIYELTGDYDKREEEISHILYKLALNQTGINHAYPGLNSDVYKAFTEVLSPKINALAGSEKLPDFSKINPSFKSKNEELICANLNTLFFIDNIGIDQNEIVPGNIYQVMDDKHPVIIKLEDKIKLQKKKENSEKIEGYYDYQCTPIAIELTPPCDFSNKKVLSRLIGGYIVDYTANEGGKKISAGDKGYVIQPICIPGNSSIKYIVFDFRYLYSPTEQQLKDPTQFKVLFRANHSLFSDILQKFSSHAARLGLSGLEP